MNALRTYWDEGLEGKVELMSDHPKLPRLGLAFSGQVEGLHGLTLGGPGSWGPKGHRPLPRTTLQEQPFWLAIRVEDHRLS